MAMPRRLGLFAALVLLAAPAALQAAEDAGVEARQPQACQTCHMGIDHPPGTSPARSPCLSISSRAGSGSCPRGRRSSRTAADRIA